MRLSGPGDQRILVALGAAEVVAEILADLRIRIADAVLVILGGDPRQRVGLVAPALEIKSGDLAENAGKAAVDFGLLAHIRGFEEIAADLGRRRRGHLLDADDEHDAGLPGRDGFQALMHGGGAGGAGIFDPGGALEAQIGRRLQHQGSGKILRRKAGIEVAEHDLVDVLGGDTGIRQRFAGNLDDEAFDRLAGELAERGMRPAHDAACHDTSPNSCGDFADAEFSSFFRGLPLDAQTARCPHHIRIAAIGFAFEGSFR